MKKVTITLATLLLAASIGSASAGTGNTAPQGSAKAPGAATATKNAGDAQKLRIEATEQNGKQCDGPQNQNQVRTSR